MRFRVSAPGKSILMGEHAAVYGRPALVAAVDRRVTAEISPPVAPGVWLELPQVGVSAAVGWPAIHSYRLAARARWKACDRSPNPGSFHRLRGEDPAHLVKVALGETAAFLGQARGPDFTLRLDSRIPIGAGFGSSAAVAVAVACAYLAFRGYAPPPEELHRLTLAIERRQHGRPSGIDNATVIYGGLVWAERDPGGELVTTPLTSRPPVLDRLRVFHSGAPGESTGEVVAAVRRRHGAEPQRCGELIDRMEAATRGFRGALKATPATPARIIALIREFEACLEELGVVPRRVKEIVRRVEEHGGAAKISGAGSLTGPGAGSLLVYHPQPAKINGWDFLRPLTPLDLWLGAPGVWLEEPGPTFGDRTAS
jgi:mevalonate kinase